MRRIRALISAWLLLHFANGAPVWVNMDQMVAVFDAHGFGGATDTGVTMVSGNTFYVKETPAEISEHLHHE